MAEVIDRPVTVLSLRKIGNSQGVVLPKSVLSDLDFSHGVEVIKAEGELRLRPVVDDNDPFGFGAAMRRQIATGTVDDLLIPDVLPEDSFD